MIIKPFNFCFLLLILFTVMMIVGITMLLKKKNDKAKVMFFCIFAGYNIILFLIYKIMLSKDSDFEFNIYNELPLQLCNINMFIIPLGVLLKKDFLKAFGFYFGTVGALMAISSPEPAFINNSIFMFRNIGFYFTHLNIMIMGVSLYTLGLFTPKMKLLPKLIIFICSLTIVIFLFDLIMTEVTDTLVNYFFLISPAGVSILDMFYNIIPVKLLYMMIPFIVALGFFTLVTYIFERVNSKKQLN